MANQITKAVSYENAKGIGMYHTITVEGYKATGTAAVSGLANDIFWPGGVGNVEENVKVSGNQGTVAGAWTALTAYDYGEIVTSLAGDATYWHMCVNDGTTGAAEPAWHGSRNNTTNDGSVVWLNLHKTIITHHDGNAYRNALIDDTHNFRLDISPQMLTVDTTDNEVASYSDRGAFSKNICWDNGDIPVGHGYEVHGYAKSLVDVTDYTKVHQGDLIFVYEGTGMGQVRRIKCVWDDGTRVHLTLFANLSTQLDETSKFYICWSPMDIVYASDANGWGLGDLVFDLFGHTLGMVRSKDFRLEIGKANGTGDVTYFGWAGYTWDHRPWSGGTSSWGQAAGVRNAKSRCFWGEADYGNGTTDVPNLVGSPAIFVGNKMSAWNTAFFSTDAGAEARNSASITIGSNTYSGRNIHGLWGRAGGEFWSYHNGPLGGPPNTYNSEGDFMNWYGGTWGGGMGLVCAFNTRVVGQKGQPTVGAANANARGFGWNGDNTGDTGENIINLINCNYKYHGVFLDGGGAQCTWWWFDHEYNDNNYIWNWLCWKTLDLKVIDKDSKLPIQGAVAAATDANGVTISEAPSGAVLTANMTQTQTYFDTDLKEKFTEGDLLRIDGEYTLCGDVPGGDGAGRIGAITPCTRAAFMPRIFFRQLHKSNTLGWSNVIYKVGNAESDAEGIVPQMELVALSMMSRGINAFDGKTPSQVTYGGLNYIYRNAAFEEVPGGDEEKTVINERSRTSYRNYWHARNVGITPGTLVVKNDAESVTYTEDVDYSVDYENGILTIITLSTNTYYRLWYDCDAAWVVGGDEGLPWDIKKYYGNCVKAHRRSYDSHVPWFAVVTAPGYKKFSSPTEPTIDDNGVIFVVELEREQPHIDQEAVR